MANSDHNLLNSVPWSDFIKKNNLRGLIELVVVVIIAFLVAGIVRIFLLQLFYIPSASMDPYLKVNDKVFVNKLAYSFHDVERGDVIVFDAPKTVKNESIEKHKLNPSSPVINDLIKRVIALPGETVEGRCEDEDAAQCVVDIYIDGKKLNEPYLVQDIIYSPFPEKQVPANAVFVMGDNRDDSEDGRVFGPIAKDTIVGRAFFRLWPGKNFGFL